MTIREGLWLVAQRENLIGRKPDRGGEEVRIHFGDGFWTTLVVVGIASSVWIWGILEHRVNSMWGVKGQKSQGWLPGFCHGQWDGWRCVPWVCHSECSLRKWGKWGGLPTDCSCRELEAGPLLIAQGSHHWWLRAPGSIISRGMIRVFTLFFAACQPIRILMYPSPFLIPFPHKHSRCLFPQLDQPPDTDRILSRSNNNWFAFSMTYCLNSILLL